MPRVSKDMKVIIAEAAKKRVTEKNVKRLTVKDIVGDCGITRQTFYYHFKDIRALLQWIVERESEKFLSDAPVSYTHLSQAMKIDTSSDYAEELYGCKVDDVNDTAAVVKLLEAMGLENVTGKYTATIAAEGDIRVLTVTFEAVSYTHLDVYKRQMPVKRR